MLTIENIGKLKGLTLASNLKWRCDMVASTNESYGFQFKCIGAPVNSGMIGTITVVELHRKIIYDADFPKDAEHNCVYEIKNMRTGNTTYPTANDINTIDKFGTWLCRNTL